VKIPIALAPAPPSGKEAARNKNVFKNVCSFYTYRSSCCRQAGKCTNLYFLQLCTAPCSLTNVDSYVKLSGPGDHVGEIGAWWIAVAGQVLHVLLDVEGALEGAHDEDEGDQGGEELLGEAGDVADVGAGVERHQEEEHDPGPDTNPQPRRK
jgi:hypothetical protein